MITHLETAILSLHTEGYGQIPNWLLLRLETSKLQYDLNSLSRHGQPRTRTNLTGAQTEESER